ncbi:MAG: lytic transglycosylase domain-containing protein [Veillonellaceae bacterium]|jgi:soluble lytic murein transglycosylase-like protein|nr:lytic transglycosylase domain-containing protein [Veillonellaceae bacterium]MDD6126996.1 lytic transglycosylase domain-containing protein [Veillonellaceae bacterium]MDD6698124.1 lytic transglycosylase domain-containing protein [Veillonellaceae bacterium]MDY6350325.1 lytic transglycosylase domain-containing protein [Selenomonas sp.]
MIDMGDITRVQQRIAQLQKSFMGLQQVPGAVGFDAQLQQAIAAQKAAEAAKGQASGANTVQSAAKTNAAQPSANATLPVNVGTGLKAVSDLPAADGDLATMVQEAARDQNVDARLVNAVAQAESGGDQSAVSPVGAIGVMQLMPDTAAGLGVNPYDKKQNIEGGAKYLREMLDTFGGDVKKAVAAYNAGPAAVKAYGGVPPYPETQAYVDRVLDLYR